jgi:hypothetical protein
MENFFAHDIGMSEYITGNRFIDICNQGTATFYKTDFLPLFKDASHDVMVTHNSDYHINNERFENSPTARRWYAQNKDYESDSITAIPIGLENMKLRVDGHGRQGTFSSEVKGALTKAMTIDRVNSYDLNKRSLVYMNFSTNTFPAERAPLWEKFKEEKWVTNSGGISLSEFYFEIAQHKFVFSPRGNGVDCHRTWEALYLRTIPIVRCSTHMNEFAELPILFVNDWDEISYNYLNAKYDEFRERLFDLSKMKISYWRERINNE